MSFLTDLGISSDFFGNFSFAGIGGWIIFVFLVFVFVLVGAVIAFFHYSNKNAKIQFRFKIPLFLKINEKYQRFDADTAKEVFVPDSNISLFFLKKRKLYIARPTRSMAKDEFWYAISENGEWINFDLSTNPNDNTLAQANYDHRDTRYAYVNLREIIKRNYKDKAVQWWKEYSPIITFVIISFIFILACWILLSKIGTLIKNLGPLTEQWTQISKNMAEAVKISQNLNSGVVSG